VADGPWLERHAHAYRCLLDARLIHKVRVERVVAAGVALILLVIVAPRLGRLVAPASAAGVARIGLSVVLAVVASEVILRKPWAASPSAPVRDFCPPARLSDLYGWGLRPSTEYTWHAGGREFTYYVNAEANRARTLVALPDHTRPTIFVAGESFALGMGVPYEQTFGALLEDRTGLQVVNIAGHGYGADQAYLRTAEVIDSFAHVVAIVTTFLPEEAIRAEAEDQPHLRMRPDGTLARQEPMVAWLRNLRVRQVLRDAIDYHGDATVDNLRAIARATADLARRHGAYPLFVTSDFGTPCIDVDGKGPWLFHSLFDDQGIPRIHVDVDPAGRIADDDPHPGPHGHRVLADAIEQALRAAHVLP
jgi:hypothetical protein